MNRKQRRAEQKLSGRIFHKTSPAVDALFAEAFRHHQDGNLVIAEQLYRQVLSLDARHADCLNLFGVVAGRTGRYELAAQAISQAIAINGREGEYYANLGNALHALGRISDAVACFAKAIDLRPDHPESHNGLGLALKDFGRLDEAVESFHKAIALRSAFPEALNNLGIALNAQGRLDEAVATYRKAIDLRPNFAEAQNNLGNSLRDLGMLDDAIASYQWALSHRPDYLMAHCNLGDALKEQGKLDEAMASYQRALSHRPDYAEAHCNIGVALKEQGKLDEAEAFFLRALTLRPDLAEAHYYLGSVRQDQDKPEEAAASLGRAMTLKPDFAEPRLRLTLTAVPILTDSDGESVGVSEKFQKSLDDLAAWTAANPRKLGRAVGSMQPFYLAYRPTDVSALLARYGDIVTSEATAYWRKETDCLRPNSAPRERVRMVVVSGHVRRHPVWNMVLRGILAHMDRRLFEIYLYHTGATTDEETVWAMAHADRFVQGPKPVKEWLREIAKDRPDVMFYPEVGIDPTTCTLATLRLAPVQMAGWGHPVTTGLPNMDIFLSGKLLEGVGAEQHYREHLVKLPGTGVCTEPLPDEPQRWEGPGRQRDAIRFALCHTPFKFDPANDVLLTRIAKAVGPCEFWLASAFRWATTRLLDRLGAAFRAEGLDPDAYLRFIPWLPPGEFIGFLDEMDVYLDCPAFSGYTTAWQAVQRGLPVVTLEGEFLRQRLAAGLLRQIDATEGIASSRDEYVETAVRWAQECRQPNLRAARRDLISRAAPRSNGNRAAVSALEQALVEALSDSSLEGRT
jgi:tetratricopeptide (TPR) repeat protein